MGYRIMYSPEDDHKYPACRPGRKNKWVLPTLLAAVIFVTMATPSMRNWLERWLIPGDPQVTKGAFSMMIDEIRSGEPLGEAVSTFCREILNDGNKEEILTT